MNDYTQRERILLMILSLLVVIPMAVVQVKYSLRTFILFSIIFVILISILNIGKLFPEFKHYHGYRRRSNFPLAFWIIIIFIFISLHFKIYYIDEVVYRKVPKLTTPR